MLFRWAASTPSAQN